MTPRLRLWVDPGCPWAWQTARWLRDLRDRGMFAIEWRLFSLEVNSAGLDVPFAEATAGYGESLTALALARREQGESAFEAYYAAIGTNAPGAIATPSCQVTASPLTGSVKFVVVDGRLPVSLDLNTLVPYDWNTDTYALPVNISLSLISAGP